MLQIQRLRAEIDELDRSMVRLWETRMKKCGEISAWKAAGEVPVADTAREAEVLACAAASLSDPGLAPYVRALYETVLRLSREYQSALRSVGGEDQ